jgi:hypothetical protein
MKGTETMKNKPNVGQWWVNVVGDPPRVHKTGIVLFVGRDSKKRLLWEDCQGHIETDYNLDWSGWHHEPACTGWDWVPEVKEEFPQWYSYKTGPFESNNDPYLVRVDSAGKQSFVHRSGKVDNVTYPYKPKELVENVRSGAWKRLSQQEADEALHPPKLIPADVVNALCSSIRKETKAEVVESPDDWVPQDRVDYRTGIDQLRWVDSNGSPLKSNLGQWATLHNDVSRKLAHGLEDGKDRLEVRCRRKDLPVVEAKTTATVTVYEVVYGDDLGREVYCQMFVGEERLKSLQDNWKYVSVVSTKTVEVML